MTTYEAVPNTDGQILIPVSKKSPVIPKAKFSRTIPPPRGAIPVSRSGALTRPTSPLVHRPISRSSILRPAPLQSRQNQISNNTLNERQARQGAAARRFRPVTPRPSNISIAAPRILNQKGTARRQEYSVSRERKASAEKDYKEGFNKISLSYIMEPPRPSHIPEENKGKVIDLTLSPEGEDEYQPEDVDEEKDKSLVQIEDSDACQYHYPSLPTNDRPNRPVFLKDFNDKYRTVSPDINAPVHGSLFNTAVKLEDVEKATRNFQFGQNKEIADMALFRVSRTLPTLPTRDAACHQSCCHMMASSPLSSFHSASKTASLTLSNLEHAAVNTLVSLNRRLDSNKSDSITNSKQLNSPNKSASTHQSPRVLTRKRPSSLISTPTSALAPNSKSSMAEFEPATKKLCMNSFLNSTSSPSSSPLPETFAPAALNPPTQIISPLIAQTLIRRKDSLASDSDHNTSTPPPPSNFYPSPPASPPHELAPMRSIPRPLVPRTSHTSNPVPNSSPNLSPNPQAHLLFFDHQAYSPLPLPSQSSPRSSSAPPIASISFSSASLSPHPRQPPRRNFACRAWKLRPSRSILSGVPPSDTSNPPKYLVIIRNDNHSNRTQSSASSNEDGNVRNWWTIINGKEDMEEIRKLFQ